MNHKFILNDWLSTFPLGPRFGSSYCAEIVTGPSQLCNNEQLRREAATLADWGEPVPVDLFIMADGEPADRRATKIAGIPYRPADLRWPTNSAGIPFSFLAQFNFSDSRDLFPDLPNDILLVFVDDGELFFEWHPLFISNPTDGSDVPQQEVPTRPCYGYIYRTLAYPDAGFFNKKIKVRGLDVDSPFLLPQFQATQIGSAPFFVQEHLRTDPLPGKYLCTISSIHPDQHTCYPFINHPDPLMPEGTWRYDLNYLMLDDVGCIYISIDDRGQLHWRDCSY